MDDVWERSTPLYDLGTEEITSIIKEYDGYLELINYNPINIGCRNSNYKVVTNKGLLLLRICPVNDESYKKEKIIHNVFYGNINIPKLLFVSEDNITQRICLIYEFILGISMQEVFAQKGKVEDSIIIQVAECASRIHSTKVIENGEFDTDYPPFPTWYDLFLENEIVTKRIGVEIKNRVKMLLADYQRDLYEIDKYICFIHADFRPANMLIDENNKIWVVDWEFSGYGHALADIGQFFRYVNCFEPSQIRLFEGAYNCLSNTKLPSDWYKLSKLRDLANPLQMLGANENSPQKFADLRSLVIDTLTFFGY
jgi:serine/threonine protein kinase